MELSGSGIRAEAEEPVLLCKSIYPLLFRHFETGLVLAGSGFHGLELWHSRQAGGGVAATVPFDDALQHLWVFENHAATGFLGDRFTEVVEQLGLRHGLEDVAVIVTNGLVGKLDDRAWFDVSPRPDVVADADDRRA